MTYREMRELAQERLNEAGIDQAEAESHLLLAHVCQTDLAHYLLHREEEMSKWQEERYRLLITERSRRIPLQHLTGVQEFFGLKLTVGEHVLIPRQETELVAQRVVGIIRELKTTQIPGETGGVRVLDLCTGSGCIAIAVNSFCPDAMVCGADISGDALINASNNAAANEVDVEWIQSDLFSRITGAFDVIVCNPPYIPTDVIDTLMPEVKDHEPRIALDGGPDGLSFYRRILFECGDTLTPGGWIVFEIGADQADAVSDLMRKNGFEDIEVTKDLAGLDRIVTGRRKTDV